jgi:hypothetical protein
MRPECVRAVTLAMGRDLNSGEARDIETRVARAMRTLAQKDPNAWQAMSTAVRLQEAGVAAAKELLEEAQLKKQRAALQIAAHQRVGAAIGDLGSRGVSGLDALDRIVAFHADGKSNTLSIETTAKAIERDALRQMLGTLEASHPKWFGLFENVAGVRDVMREIFGEDTGNAEAKAGAAEWHKVAEALRQRFNRAGGDVGQLEDWGLPHHHSQLRVAKAGRERWVADTLPLLNRERYVREDGTRMSDAELAEFLGHAWETIATGGANKIEPGQFRGNGARANRGSESRQIHFANADGYLDYQSRYGERTLYEVMVGHIAGVAKDIALVETLGPNPDHAWRFFRDEAVREAKLAKPTASGKIDGAALRSESLYNVVSGRRQPVASEYLAKSFDTLRAWLTASRLGSAVISSLSDDATLYLTAHVNNLPEMRVLANELAALNPANRMEERLALRAGLAMNTLIASINRFGQDGLGASFSHKLASTVLRASGLNAITEARRRAFGVTMMSSLGSVVREHATLKDLDATDRRILRSKGITEKDFAVWKKAQPEDWGGGNDTMLTPDAIYSIPDAELRSLGDPTMLKEQAATRLLGAVLEETDVAVIEPGAKERAFMGSGLQRGTWKGELTRSFFLFKSFPLAMIFRHWARGMSMPTGAGRAAYLSTLIAATTILGAASMQIREVLAGRDPRNLNPFGEHGVRNWIKAMLQGGSLGLYGDFLFSDSTQYGQSPVASFLGPVVGLGEDIFKLTQGNLLQASQGKDTNLGAEVVRFVRGNLPGANLWYSKAALDHLIFHQLQEYFSPGYLAQMRQRAYREFGQRYWWEPGEALPYRAPDATEIIGE